jgi:hypothetical protein
MKILVWVPYRQEPQITRMLSVIPMMDNTQFLTGFLKILPAGIPSCQKQLFLMAGH